MAENLDFRNPFLSATIVTPDGERFPLWLKTSAMAQSAARLGTTHSLPFVSEIQVELQLAYLPIIKVTLTPPYRDAINFLDSKLIEWGQSILEVQFGYVMQQPKTGADRSAGQVILSNVYSGVILKPEVSLGEDVTIVLNAQGVGGFAAVRQEGKLTIKATRKEIVKQLLQRFNIEIDDSEVIRSTTEQAQLAAEWNKVPVNFAQGGDSFWTAAVKVIREAGCHSYLLGNEIKVLPASYVFSSTPTKLFRLYDFPNGRLGPVSSNPRGVNRIMPILSASSPTTAIYLPGSAQGFFLQDINSFDREEIKKFIGDRQVSGPRTGEGAAQINNPSTLPAADTTTGEGAEQFPGDPSDSQFVQQVKSEYAAQSTLMGVQLNLESMGDPTTLPGTVIAVRGLGQRLAGNYSIFKVVHTIGSNGYTMSIECVSNVSQALKNAVVATGPKAPEPVLDSPDDTGFGRFTMGLERM